MTHLIHVVEKMTPLFQTIDFKGFLSAVNKLILVYIVFIPVFSRHLLCG